MLLQFCFEEKKNIVKRLHECTIVVTFTSIRKLQPIEVFIEFNRSTRSQTKKEVVKESKTPWSDFIGIRIRNPCHRHMTASTPMRSPMIFSCFIDFLRQRANYIRLMPTLRTHPPDINWNEWMIAFLARVIHLDMFCQTTTSPESSEPHLMYRVSGDEKDYFSGLQSESQQYLRGVSYEE